MPTVCQPCSTTRQPGRRSGVENHKAPVVFDSGVESFCRVGWPQPRTSVRQFSGVMRTMTSVELLLPRFFMKLSVYIAPAFRPRYRVLMASSSS